jgi:hypothetical protein
MTNQNKKRARGYRGPAPAEQRSERDAPPSRRGFLDGLLTPRYPDSAMPKKSTSVGRGFITAASSPAIVGSMLLSVFAGWMLFVALGFQGPFALMASFLALPPLGTVFDSGLVGRLFHLPATVSIFALVGLRSLLLAVFTSLVVDGLRGVRQDRWSIVRCIKILPVTLAVCVLALGLTILTRILGALLGAGLGFLAVVATLVGGVYLFAYAPVIALTEGRGVSESLSKSVRAARMPGTTNLAFASFYGLAMFAVLFGSGGGKLGVNPSPQGWAVVLFVNFLQVAMMGAFAFRYLSVAEAVPDAAARKPRSARR